MHSSITPELAINPLGDRIVHTFFRDSANKNDSNSSFANEESAADVISERVNFPDFVRVLAHFRPLKKNVEKNKLNGREEKLRCGCALCRLFLEFAGVTFNLIHPLNSCISDVRP